MPGRIRRAIEGGMAEAGEASNAVENAANWAVYLMKKLCDEGLDVQVKNVPIVGDVTLHVILTTSEAEA